MQNNYAHPAVRLLAYLIDLAIYSSAWLLLLFFVSGASNQTILLNNLLGTIILGFVILPLLAAFVYVFLTSRYGGSPGQLLTGIAVVDEKDRYLSLPMAFFRTFVGAIVSGTIFWLGFLWMIWDEKRQGWHDKISGSYVVVKNKTGWLVGLAALIILVVANAMLVTFAVGNFAKNGGVYQSIVTQIETIFKKNSQPSVPLELPPAPSNRASQTGV